MNSNKTNILQLFSIHILKKTTTLDSTINTRMQRFLIIHRNEYGRTDNLRQTHIRGDFILRFVNVEG